MKQKLWLTLTTCLAYCIDRELYKAIDYLREQVRVLIEQQEKDKRILLNDFQRISLADVQRQLWQRALDRVHRLGSSTTQLSPKCSKRCFQSLPVGHRVS